MLLKLYMLSKIKTFALLFVFAGSLLYSFGQLPNVPLDGDVIIPFKIKNININFSDIRSDHPRLFFNADTWESVKSRALSVTMKKEYDLIKDLANKNIAYQSDWDSTQINWPAKRPGYSIDAGNWGYNVMAAAFVYRISPTPELLTRIKEMLFASLDYYQACYDAGRAVNWYVYTRIGWLAAVDWVWNDLTAEERQSLGTGIFRHVDDIFSTRYIIGRNADGITSSTGQNGYYGEGNIALYAGLVFYNEGIENQKALQYLERGKTEYEKIFSFRKLVASVNGGLVSPTLAYSIIDYPIAEWNFFHCWEAATGLSVANTIGSYVSLFPNYVFWNVLPATANKIPREWGIGDVDHMTNELKIEGKLYANLSHVMHFYKGTNPEHAALAAYLRKLFGGGYFRDYEYAKGSSSNYPKWFSNFPIYPFLLTNVDEDTAGVLPPQSTAMYFDTHGQVMMRSGDGPNDTYALFTCGGIVKQHRQYDDNHFIIFRKGYMALDAGTRHGNAANLQNYYAQTVAHNSILINMPGESAPQHWNGTVYSIDGGQYQVANGQVVAYETSKYFTYVAGDATTSYRSTKCKEAVRQFVFIPPYHFIVYDRVESNSASYPKRWLLHHVDEPILSDRTWSTTHEDGKIFCKTLLPVDATFNKIGGPGKYFWADGKNWPIDAPREPIAVERDLAESTLSYPTSTMGRWRMEVSPGAARTKDAFLHVIQMCDKVITTMDNAILESDGSVTIQSGSRTINVKFNETGDIGGNITIKEGETILVSKPLANYIQEKQPQTYYVRSNGNDDNSGTSEQQAVKTVSKAIEIAINNGDVIDISGTVDFFREVPAMKTINNSLTIRGDDKNTAVIVGTQTGGLRPMEIGSSTKAPLVSIENLTFKNFHSATTTGSQPQGGVIDFIQGSLMCKRVIFENNTAYQGGALSIRTQEYPNSNTVLIQDCYFKNNSALKTTTHQYARGGAVFVYSYSRTSSNLFQLTIDKCTFDSNAAEHQGSALYILMGTSSNNDRVIVKNCTFVNNKNNNGGLNLTYPETDHGAIYIQPTGTGTQNAEVSFINNTIAYNQSEKGSGYTGGLHNTYQKLRLINNILYNNTNSEQKTSFRTTVNIIESRNNIVDTLTESLEELNKATVFSNNQDNVTGEQLKLATNLMDNGGATPTLSIGVNSIAINAGYTTNVPLTDQRGVARVGIPDVGAYEYNNLLSTKENNQSYQEFRLLFAVTSDGLISRVDGLLQVFSVDGRILKSESVVKNQLVMIPQGIYIMHVLTANTKLVQKVIVN